MKKGTAWLIIILALIIGVAIGLNFPNPREGKTPGQEPQQGTGTIENPEDCEDGEGFACTGEEVVVEESILTNSGILTLDVIGEIKENGHFQGNSDSTYLWIEYSDLQCPYCKDLHNEQISQEIMTEYLGGNVDFAFKHYPKAFHTEGLPAHQQLECIAQQQGVDGFYQAIDLVFANEEKLSPALMTQVMTDLGINLEEANSCLESGKYRATIFSHIGEAVGLFDAKYVPSTVIINTENGKWISYVGNETKEKIIKELVNIE